MLKNKRIMTILAHPDDETLGCGGILHKFNNQNILCLIPVKRIEEQCKSALKTLGIGEAKFGEFEDNNIQPIKELTKWIESHIERFNPDIIITHFDKCLNQDHRTLYEACVIATRPIKNHITLLSCEIPSSTGFLDAFKPNYYVELSPEDIVKKMKAVEDYASEFRKSRSPEVISALARVRGAESGYDYAEAFQIIRCYEN